MYLKNNEKLTCDVCHTVSTASDIFDVLQEDKVYKELIDNGTLRPCPKCSKVAAKDFGICNVIQCMHCGIWWNWATRDTGTNKDELKNKARRAGQLWLPGELEYQLQLQSEEPEKFKKLLESNGIKYDPNYVRGR